MSGPHWGRAPDILWRATATAVVVRPRSGDETTVLSGTGAALWELLEPPRSVAELAVGLAQRFASDPVNIATDVTATLLELERRRIVRALG